MTKPITWTTKHGTVIRVRDMKDDHLINCIKYLRRTHSIRCLRAAWQADIYAADAPDGASMAAANAAEGLLELADDNSDEAISELIPEFSSMLREAKKRKLTIAKEEP